MSLYFVGGIHGSGKTTLCEWMSLFSGVPFYSAGALIRLAIEDDVSGTKAVADVGLNQQRLVAALEKVRGGTPHLLLDGHFTLIDPQGAIQRIGLEVFRQLNPVSLVLVNTEPRQIVDQLFERDGRRYDLTFIDAHREAEEVHARMISSELEIPLLVVNPAAMAVEEILRMLELSSTSSQGEP